MEYSSIEFQDVLAFAEDTDLFGQHDTLLEQLRRHTYDEALRTCSMVVAEYFQAYRADGMCGRQVNQVPLYRRLVQLELMIMILAMQEQGKVLAPAVEHQQAA
jgi:hypothetical protein